MLALIVALLFECWIGYGFAFLLPGVCFLSWFCLLIVCLDFRLRVCLLLVSVLVMLFDWGFGFGVFLMGGLGYGLLMCYFHCVYAYFYSLYI